MKATEDFLETVLFAHISAAAEEIVERENNSLISFHELCKKVVSDFVKVTVPCNETNTPNPENEMQDAVHMYAVDFLPWVYFGMHIGMLSERETGIGLSDIGNFLHLSLDKSIIITMQMKDLTFWHKSIVITKAGM